MHGTRHFVRVLGPENFDNAVKFVLLKALFYTFLSLRISNWKINSHKIKQLAKTRICQGNTQVHLQFFLQIKTLVDKQRLSCYANGSF